MALVPANGITTLTEKIIGCGIRVHRVFGPGLLEAPYQLALISELEDCGLGFEAEVPMSVTYGEKKFACGYKLDIVVERVVVVEIKAVEKLLPVHRAQLLTYLKLSGYPAGLLMNFNVKLMKDGIVRVLNNQPKKHQSSP